MMPDILGMDPLGLKLGVLFRILVFSASALGAVELLPLALELTSTFELVVGIGIDCQRPPLTQYHEPT